MELRKVCCLTYQVPYYPGKPYGIWVTKPQPRVKLNGIRCVKFSTAVTTLRAHPDRYEKDFDAVIAILAQYINKRAPTLSVKIVSLGQNRPAKWQRTSTTSGAFKGKI